jgi:CubicO group peptidase (beta-lactamase class C family)
VALADFARQHIFAPLAMNHTAFPGGKQELAGVAREYSARGSRFRHSIPPLVAGDGGLQTSVEDFALWDENFYTPTVGGKRMVDFLEEPGRLRSGMLVRYAAGLELAMFRGLPAIGHDGVLPGSRSDLVRFPSQHLTVMCLLQPVDLGDQDGTLFAALTISQWSWKAERFRDTAPEGNGYVDLISL